MPTISLTIAGDTPSSVSLIALTRDDTGLAPSGITLPGSFTPTNGAWVYPFTDSTPPTVGYNYTYQLNWSDGSSDQQIGSIAAASSGLFGTQGGIEGWYGVTNVAIWSNKENTSSLTADSTAINAAITRAENYFNSRLRGAGYAYPLPNTSADVAIWADLINEYAGVLLFLGRGEVENEDTKNLAGQMEAHRVRVMSDLQRLLAGALDCPRTYSTAVTIYDPRPQAAADGYPVPRVLASPFPILP